MNKKQNKGAGCTMKQTYAKKDDMKDIPKREQKHTMMIEIFK